MNVAELACEAYLARLPNSDQLPTVLMWAGFSLSKHTDLALRIRTTYRLQRFFAEKRTAKREARDDARKDTHLEGHGHEHNAKVKHVPAQRKQEDSKTLGESASAALTSVRGWECSQRG